MGLIGFIGIDQYGKTYILDKHPRKELMDQLGTTHAEKMYRDIIVLKGEKKTTETVHVGYVIRGLWITVYKTFRMDLAKTANIL